MVLIIKKKQFAETPSEKQGVSTSVQQNLVHEMIYWMRERQAMYRRRFDQGLPADQWTSDPVLKAWRFCNVFRELDKVTIWIRENWRNPYDGHERLPFAMCVARMFNSPDSLAQIGFPETWDKEAIKERLHAMHNEQAVFNSAYMITNAGSTKNKIDLVVDDFLTPLWENPMLIDPRSLKNTWQILRGYDGFGDFMAYEVVSDLRHTSFLRNAKDIYTWANAGPGAKRGLNRIFCRPVNNSISPFQAQEEMQNLLRICKEELYHDDPMFQDLEMRDIEHSLCETDKYLRAKMDGRQLKQVYGEHVAARRNSGLCTNRYSSMVDRIRMILEAKNQETFTREEVFEVIDRIRSEGGLRAAAAKKQEDEVHDG